MPRQDIEMSEKNNIKKKNKILQQILVLKAFHHSFIHISCNK